MEPGQFREGIFNLRTRRFGTVAEVMIKRLVKLGKSKNQFHDLYDDMAKKRVEVKFSTVMEKHRTKVTESTVLHCIEDALSAKREVSYERWEEVEFDCNMQQIKRSEFDFLYYGLFFANRILIFRIKSEDIESKVNYSDFQHKGNVGEGQFHITQKTLQGHINDRLYKSLTYKELLELLT